MQVSFSRCIFRLSFLPLSRKDWRFFGLFLVFVAALFFYAGQAQAQTALVGEAYKKVNQLIMAKNYEAALRAADTYLATNSNDPQMRLIKTRALIAQGRNDEARNQLLSITQEFPEIAEPYNNLAVLYAQAGELETARASLETALRINPNYAVALQNMGDLHQRMAEAFYSRAAALQPNNRKLQEKIRAIQAVSP